MFDIPSLLTTAGEGVWERIHDWYQNSLIHETFAFLEERYFTVHFDAYENFSLGSNAAVTARNIILGLTFGIFLAAIMTSYTRTVLGNFIRKLIKSDTMSPDHAKTLSELGFFRSTAVRRELAHGVILRKIIRCTEEEDDRLKTEQERLSYEERRKDHPNLPRFSPKLFRLDFTTMHFYLPQDLHYRADVRFDRNGSGWLLALVTAVLAIVLAGVLCWFLPDVFRLLDHLISYTAP